MHGIYQKILSTKFLKNKWQILKIANIAEKQKVKDFINYQL